MQNINTISTYIPPLGKKRSLHISVFKSVSKTVEAVFCSVSWVVSKTASKFFVTLLITEI